jgi:hypothetical protein
MISTCAGIDKYAFYLDFKDDLSSKPQVSVSLHIQTQSNRVCNFHVILLYLMLLRDHFFYQIYTLMLNMFLDLNNGLFLLCIWNIPLSM